MSASTDLSRQLHPERGEPDGAAIGLDGVENSEKQSGDDDANPSGAQRANEMQFRDTLPP